MSNPWAIKLKKTGFLEKHLETEKSKINELEERQLELRTAEITNNVKIQEYKNRQEGGKLTRKNKFKKTSQTRKIRV